MSQYVDAVNAEARYTESKYKKNYNSFYQIIWFKKGKGKHFVDFKEYEVADNSIFIIN